MNLPAHIRTCLELLEQAGHAAYCVGGCVRDHVLGKEPHDYDLCTAATPQQIKQVFSAYPQVLSGEKHGTVMVILDHQPVEITTFRTEGDYTDNRHPGWVRFEQDIAADLSRRDFTVNAMAWSPTRGFADPFGGREDLKNGILRAVGDPESRFREDGLRILRGMRFATRFRLQAEPATEKAMFRLRWLLDGLSRERVLTELWGFLPYAQGEDLVRFAPLITQVIPELAPCVGFDQHSRHHIHDIYVHTAHTVAAMPADPVLRMAALLHDVGKPLCADGQGHFYGHETQSAQMAEAVLTRLKASNEIRTRVTELIARHMQLLTPERKLLRRRLSQWGEQALLDQLAMQRADRIGTGTGDLTMQTEAEAMVQDLLQEQTCLTLKDLAINGHDLMALGLSGPQIGHTLSYLLTQVLDEQLPNQRDVLLLACRSIKEESAHD